jgi:inorganic pyrophosphatase
MNISYGKNAPEEVNVFIEIPKGSNVKYELDKESGVIFVDRFSSTSMFYPANYGYVPGTLSEDGDPVDVLVLSEQAVVPGVVIPSRPVAMLEMEDESGIDAKIIAVPAVTGDAYSTIEDLSDISEMLTAQIKHFFENYKSIDKGKWVKIKDWKDKASAIEEIRKGMESAK